MINIYIKELEKEEFLAFYKLPKWTRETTWKVIKKLNIILKRQIGENKKIYFIPNIEKENIYNKLNKKLKKEKTQTQKIQIVLSKKLKNYKHFFKDYKIIDGNNIFVNSIENILKEILKENEIALQDIYVLTNSYSQESISLIKKIAPKVKTMNIITKEIQKYQILEEMLEEQSITMTIANNKRKSLKKAKIIINLNFSKEELNQYAIFRNAIIINLTEEKITNLKGFEGMIIQDIELELEEDKKDWINKNNLQTSFKQIEIYESLIEKNIRNLEIKIKKLYGNNGQISEKELRNWQKLLTN